MYIYNTGKNKPFSQLVSVVAIVKEYSKFYEFNYHIFCWLQQSLFGMLVHNDKISSSKISQDI